MPHLRTLADFRNIFDLRFNNLVIYAVGLGMPYEHAKDIVQECFIKLWENHSTISNPTPWLFTSVRNSSINWLKSSANTPNKRVRLEEIQHNHMDESSLEEIIEHFHKIEKAYARIQELGGRCKDIFIMVYLEKMRIKDVAQDLGISENTVKTYLKRGKEAMRLLSIGILATIIIFS